MNYNGHLTGAEETAPESITNIDFPGSITTSFAFQLETIFVSLPENVLQDDFRLAPLSLLLAPHLLPLPLSHLLPCTLMLDSVLNPGNFAVQVLCVRAPGTQRTLALSSLVPVVF